MKKMASKSMNTLYLEQLAFLRQKRLDERGRLVRAGRKTILSLLMVLVVVALFIHFLFPLVLGHPVPPLVSKGSTADPSVLLHQAFAQTSALAQSAETHEMSLRSVQSWYQHRTEGIGQLARAVPRFVLSQDSD